MRFVIIVLVCTTLSFKAAASEPLSLVKRQAGSHKIGVVCPNTNEFAVACTKCDGSWPTTDLTCQNQLAFPHSTIRTIQDGVTDQTLSAREPCSPPQHIAAKCGNQNIYSLTRPQDQVEWTLYYKMETQCACKKGKDPICIGATGLSNEACNFATITFCGASAGGAACTV